MDLGFEKNGFEVELVNEFLPAFIEAYKFQGSAWESSREYGYFNIDINEF